MIMSIQEQIQQYRNQAAIYNNWASEATDEASKAHWKKLAQAKIECAEILEENDQDNVVGLVG
jgi:hypothetical protein